MAHRFQVGEFVDFKPTGSKDVGLFKLSSVCPKSSGLLMALSHQKHQEGFERTVSGWDLSPSIVPEGPPQPVNRLMRAGSRE